MKSIPVFIFACIILTSNSVGQNISPKYLIRIQPFNSFIWTNYEIPWPGETSVVPVSGLQSSMLFPISVLNVGGGIGISYCPNDKEPDSFFPNVFIMIEVGNSKKRNLVSGIFMTGITRGWVSGKDRLYLAGGPSLNFKSHFEKVNISFNPYFGYYPDWHDIVTTEWNGHDKPITTEHHWVKYTNLTYNFSIIIQLNHLNKF